MTLTDTASPTHPSLMNRWNGCYQNATLKNPVFWGPHTTYLAAAAFLADIDEVEDWGCGGGGFKSYCVCPAYIGVDGSYSPFANRIVDLSDYESSCDGILLRHVLEHNYDWDKILTAAIKSFRKKLCIVLFTPFSDKVKVVGESHMEGLVIPDLSFVKSDFENYFADLNWRLLEVQGNPQEHVYMIWR